MTKKVVTNDGKKGGWLVGKRHYDKNGKSLGGIKAVVTDAGNKPVELEGGEVIINREASKKYWKELSKINQSAGNGVAIEPPSDAFDEDPSEEYENGGKIEFNANHIPNKWILNYAIKIKEEHPDVWALGGNIFGNQAFINLKRVAERGHWLDSEEWMYKKWRAFVARHKGDFRIQGVIAMLKWVDKVDKGWQYMKNLIEEEIKKREARKSKKMQDGGGVTNTNAEKFMQWYIEWYKPISDSINITFSLPNELLPFKEKNVVILDLFEKKNQNIDAKKYLHEIVKKADELGVTIYLEPKPSDGYYKNSGFNVTENKKFMKRLPQMNNGGNLSKTPAPASERIKGSKFNASGTAKDSKSGASIKFDDKTIASIQSLIDAHNEKYPSKKITLGVAKAVVRRGMGAYSSTHRPTITGGKPNSRTAWGLARLKAFIHKAEKGKSKSGKYSQDNDLFDDLNIKVSKFDNGGGVREMSWYSGFKKQQLKKGTEHELEHADTIEKFKKKGVSDREVAAQIAKDHLEEDENYYIELNKMERKKFQTGGLVTTYGGTANVGDKGQLSTRKGRVNIQITNITDKWVIFNDLDEGGKRKDTPRDKFIENYKGNAPIGSSVQSQTMQTTTPQTSGEWRVKTWDELKTQGLLKDDLYIGLTERTLKKYEGKNVEDIDRSIIGGLDSGQQNLMLYVYDVDRDLFTKDPLPLPSTQSTIVQGQTQSDIYQPKKSIFATDLFNTKIIVDTPEKSEAFQKIAFELGIDWKDGQKTLKNIDKKYLLIDNSFSKEQTLGFASNNNRGQDFYESSSNKEIQFDDLFELKGQAKPVLSDESLQELFKDVKAIDKEREALEATPQKNETQINDELKAVEDEYSDLLFLIDITPSTDVDNMLALKLQAKQLKDKIDLLHLDLKKKIDGELQLLDNLFNASSVKPQERYKFNAYNDGFAPDGQPTSLPKNLYDWTMTEEFQNWFGNFTNAYNYRNSSYENVPCSVVVNKHYEPLVVYHGTGVEFSFFKFDKFPAMYFAENEAYSNWFAEMKGQQSGTNGYVYPFFLNIRTPLDLTIYGIEPVSPDDFIDWMFLQTGLDADELKISKALLDPSQKFQAWMYLRNSPEMLNVLRDKAVCDGIIYYEDNPSVDKSSDAYQTKAYIVFNSNSAKIADPNREMMTIPAMRSFYLKRGGKL